MTVAEFFGLVAIRYWCWVPFAIYFYLNPGCRLCHNAYCKGHRNDTHS
jgi:hypothetical protein